MFAIEITLCSPHLFRSHNSTKMSASKQIDAIKGIVDLDIPDEAKITAIEVILNGDPSRGDRGRNGSSKKRHSKPRQPRGQNGGSSRRHRNPHAGAAYTPVESADGKISDEEQNQNVINLFKNREVISGGQIPKIYYKTYRTKLRYPEGELKAYLTNVKHLEAFHPNPGEQNVSYRLRTDDLKASTAVKASTDDEATDNDGSSHIRCDSHSGEASSEAGASGTNVADNIYVW